MKQKNLLTTLLLLFALIVGSVSTWADKITDYTNIVSGTQYYIGATTGGTDYYLSVDGSSTATGVSGTAVTSKANATVFTFAGSGTSWTIQFESGNYLSLASSKANGKVNVVADAATFTASNQSSKIRLTIGSYSIQKNNSGTQFGSYGNTQTDIWLEAATSAYTITAQSNNDSYGTVSLSGTVITGSPNSGYRYANPAYTVSPANSATVSQEGNAFTVTPSASTTVTINFEAIPCYTVTFADDNSTQTEYSAGVGVTLPTRTDLNGYEFAGWSETNVITETTTAPIIIPAGTYYPTADMTLYPVYTKAGGGAAAPSSFSVGDTGDYAIVSAAQNGKYYALPVQPTLSSGKITAQEITVSELDGVKYVTTTNASDFTWTIAAATNGYTLSDGNGYIYHSNGGSSGTNLGYGETASYTWSFTADGDYVTMAGMSGSTTNNRGMLFSGTTIGGYALSNANSSGYYKVMILPISAGSITYYWSSPVAAAVEQPVITVGANPFLFSTTATITCATDGATIKYSYDNSTWNDYSAALTITETTTIYAKAIKGDDESAVASVEVTKNLATPTVTVSGDLTLDLDGGTDVNAGTLTAAVTYEDAAVAGATVTWSSSNTDIATIDASGAVIIKATGEVTFTATYAANSDYAEATDTKTVTIVDSKAPGATEQNPYTVAQAIANTPASGTSANVYIRGIVSSFYNTSVMGDGSNYRYYISDDGTTTDQLLVYKGKKNSTDNFSDAGDLEVGDVVVIYGGLTTYNSTKEVAKDNYIVSRTTKTVSDLTKTGDIELSAADLTATATATDYFTTSSTGALSYEIADEAVATVSDAGVVTPVAVGSTTLTVSQAADATYKAGSLEITVTVAAASLNSTTIVANANGSTTYGTNKVEDYMIDDTYDGTVAAVSSNPDVATVAITQHTAGEGTFTITPVAVGTSVITISAPATATCEAATDVTYTITVLAPVGQTTAVAAATTLFNETFAGCTSTGGNDTDGWNGTIASGTLTDGTSTDNSGWTFTNGSAANGCAKFGSGSSKGSATTPAIGTAGTLILSFKAAAWNGNSEGTTLNLSVSEGTIDKSSVTMTKGAFTTFTATITDATAATTITFEAAKASNNRFFLDDVKVTTEGAELTAKLNGSGYATYCSQYPLDFTNASGYTAWQITEVSGETITFSQITGSIKGGQGILLKGTAGETITLTSADSENVLSDNLLEGTLAPMYVARDKYYGLSGDKFVKIDAGNVPAGKALLDAEWVSATGARQLTFVFEGESTGIAELNAHNSEFIINNSDAVYNLAGQRVAQPTKGLYIVGGRKVILK